MLCSRPAPGARSVGTLVPFASVLNQILASPGQAFRRWLLLRRPFLYCFSKRPFMFLYADRRREGCRERHGRLPLGFGLGDLVGIGGGWSRTGPTLTAGAQARERERAGEEGERGSPYLCARSCLAAFKRLEAHSIKRLCLVVAMKRGTTS